MNFMQFFNQVIEVYLIHIIHVSIRSIHVEETSAPQEDIQKLQKHLLLKRTQREEILHLIVFI